MVIAFGLFQWGVARVFLTLRTGTPWYWPFPTALVLTVLPLVAARFLPLATPGASWGSSGSRT